MSKIKKEFKEWAISLAGCDGGDQKSDVWFCGIEWGTSELKKGNEKAFYQKLFAKKDKYSDHYAQLVKPSGGYERSLSKLYAAIKGINLDGDYGKLKDHKIFKLNLYPISFRNISHELWKEHHLQELTGIENKEQYLIWCLLNRFPELQKITNETPPKIIVCTGTSFLTEFAVAFGGKDGVENGLKMGKLDAQSESNKKYSRYYYHMTLPNTKKTKVFIIPFFSGAYGLNSDYLLKEMGKKIKEEANFI